MKTIQIEIPEGKKAEWVNGVLTLVDEKPQFVYSYKFSEGDKVVYKHDPDKECYTVEKSCGSNGRCLYEISRGSHVVRCVEDDLEPYVPQDITDIIKTYDDAKKWCDSNGKGHLSAEYDLIKREIGPITKDLCAYLRMRVIACALNEGCDPTSEDVESRWRVIYCKDDDNFDVTENTVCVETPTKIEFKSRYLAVYAAEQFSDIYTDFFSFKAPTTTNGDE